MEFFQVQQACGLIGIKGLLDFANNNECSMIRAMLYNSGDVSNDKQKVVGYGSWFMYTDTRNEYLERYYSKYIINLAKNSIVSALNG